MSEVRIGVVGYCPPTRFDETEAAQLIDAAYDEVAKDYPDASITIDAGLTALGVLKIAYEKAVRRGWRTAGIACKKAITENMPLFPVDEEPRIVGEEWGQESIEFTRELNALIKIGHGKQSTDEANLMRATRRTVYEYELDILIEDTTA
jgi:hypothetical protein